MGPGILPETTIGKHNLLCHLQMPTKALSCKKEAICEHGPEVPSYPDGQGSFKIKSKIKSLLLSLHHSTCALVSEILENVLQTVQKQFTYRQYIQTYTEENVQNTHTYTQYTQCTF